LTAASTARSNAARPGVDFRAMSEEPSFGITPYHHFFLQYGQFLAAWNSFDVLVEIALMRELRLTTKETCIVFASVGFGAKSFILGALLTQSEAGKEKYALITSAIQLAERNGFAHGFISVSDDQSHFTMVRRAVKGSLEVRPKIMTSLTMQKHLHVFGAKFQEAQAAFAISDGDLIIYQREVESYAKAPQAQDTPHPEAKTNSSASKKSPRKQYRARTIAARKR
jgi:hypothetical protein